MYYLINDDPDRRYDDIDAVLEECVTTEYFENDTDDFDNYLDEDQNIEICGYDFSPSEVLRGMNYDAYQRELTYWAEDRAQNAKDDYAYELNRAEDGEDVWVCEYRVYCYDDDEEDDEETGDTDGDDSLAFKRLEDKLAKEKEAEALKAKQDKQTENDFLSALGIQII